MSFDRVIQDSDEEDDPLLEECPPRVNPPEHPPRHATNGDVQGALVDGDPNPHITVNFDQFINPQDSTLPAGISPSQQRREERWIPAAAGGASIGMGSMMSEIGLAQRRLFDDENPHQYHHQHHTYHAPPPAGVWSDSLHPEMVPAGDNRPFDTMDSGDGFQGGQYSHGYHPDMPGGPDVQTEAPYIPTMQLDAANNTYPDNTTTTTYYHEPTAHAQYQYTSLQSNNYTQSNPSYNIFESSLRPSNSANPIMLNPHDTIPSESAQNGVRRWNSMQGLPSSPQDTEPNSSLLSSNAARARSDNAGVSGAQQPSKSVDEIALPAAAPPPLVEKKRGRPKKQSLPDTGDDDELARPVCGEAVVEQTNKPEKRKPGRPSKSAKALQDACDDNGVPNKQNEAIDVSNKANGSSDQLHMTIDDGPQQDPLQPQTDVQIDMTNTSQDNLQTHPYNPPLEEPSLAEPPKKQAKEPKEPKKKKLKRGKTTSVTLQKTVESDVEDDMIWVDERPVKPAAQENTSTPNPNADIPNPPNENGTLNQTAPESIQPEAAPAPAPKKRGRKRKKISEQLAAEQADSITEAPVNDQKESQQQNEPIAPEITTTSEDPINPPHDNPIAPRPSSPTKEKAPELPETPKKPDPVTPNTGKANKGPNKHSPISSTSKVPYRVGLSRKARIAPLLKIVKR